MIYIMAVISLLSLLSRNDEGGGKKPRKAKFPGDKYAACREA